MPKPELLSGRAVTTALRLLPKQTAKTLFSLTDKARVKIIQLVLNDRKVAERLRDTRFRVVGLDLRAVQPKEDRKSLGWLVVVGIYDYDRNVLLSLTVDPEKNIVTGIEERERLQPALTSEEIEEAQAIISSNPKFRILKRNPRLEVVAFPARAAFCEQHRCFRHRCFNFYFWKGGKQPKKVAQAVVDLSTRQLIPWDDAKI